MSKISRRTLLGAAAVTPLLAQADTRIIDPHVHVWKHDPQFPFARGANVPARDATPEMLLGLMKANGVSRTVLIQVIHYRYDNSYVASVMKRYAGTFQAVCRVDPLDPAAPDHLSELTEQGFRGVRISPAAGASGDWFGGPLMPPLWKRCRDLRVPMTVLAPIQRMPGAAALLEKVPDLTVVIDHMADCPVDRPAELEKLILLQRYPNVFVKISHTWSISRQDYFKTALPLAGRAGARQAPVPRVRTPAPHVGYRLADRRGSRDVRASAQRGSRRHALPQCRRPALDAERDHRARLAVPCLEFVITPIR